MHKNPTMTELLCACLSAGGKFLCSRNQGKIMQQKISSESWIMLMMGGGGWGTRNNCSREIFYSGVLEISTVCKLDPEVIKASVSVNIDEITKMRDLRVKWLASLKNYAISERWSLFHTCRQSKASKFAAETEIGGNECICFENLTPQRPSAATIMLFLVFRTHNNYFIVEG